MKASFLPACAGRIGLGVIVYLTSTESREHHRLQLHLENATGNAIPLRGGKAVNVPSTADLFRVHGEFRVPAPALMERRDGRTVLFAFNFDGIVFPEAGPYKFVLAIDDGDQRVLRFRVVSDTNGPEEILNG